MTFTSYFSNARRIVPPQPQPMSSSVIPARSPSLRSARSILASCAWVGSLVVLLSRAHVQWPGLAFASATAATLGLYAQRSTAAVERAALVIPSVTLAALTCALAQWGRQPMPLIAFILLLVAIVTSSVIAARSRGDRLSRRSQKVLDYFTYLCTAAVIPLALWVVGAYQRLGIT